MMKKLVNFWFQEFFIFEDRNANMAACYNHIRLLLSTLQLSTLKVAMWYCLTCFGKLEAKGDKTNSFLQNCKKNHLSHIQLK
jgi:hypothetical protein